MDKFPTRRSGNQWTRTSGTNALKTATFSTAPSRSGSAPTPAQGLSTVSVPDRAQVLGSIGRKGGLGAGAGAWRSKGGSAPSEADKLFKLRLVERSAEHVMATRLKDVTYDPAACRDMCPEVASAILDKVQGFSLEQYKLVCVVSLGSLKEKPGVQFGSRCLWNKDTDNFVSVKYSNGSVYAVALIFGLYFD